MKTKRLQLMIMATLFLGVNIGGASVAQLQSRSQQLKRFLSQLLHLRWLNLVQNRLM